MEAEATESLLFKGRDVIVIQYVGSSMADELLSKYPDNSAFDFDYSQSSIWSPLVPRFHSLSCLAPKSPDLNRKLSFDNDCKVFDKIPLSRIKKKIYAFGLNLNSKFQKKRKKMLMSVKFNAEPIAPLPSSPPSRKGWKKLLKMTSKQFKKKRDHHHHPYHHPISDVTLFDYFQSPNF